MSVQALAWVFDNSEAEGSDRLAMLVIANYADRAGLCWPSYESIARDGRYDRSSAIRQVARLEKDHHLIVIRRTGRQQSNLYLIVGMSAAAEFLDSVVLAAFGKGSHFATTPRTGARSGKGRDWNGRGRDSDAKESRPRDPNRKNRHIEPPMDSTLVGGRRPSTEADRVHALRLAGLDADGNPLPK